jgi:hypothetical protein
MYYTRYSFFAQLFQLLQLFFYYSNISKDYYPYYSNWGPFKLIIRYCDKLYLLVRIISIKLIYYYTNYSIKMVQGGWHGPNSTSHSLHVTGPRHCPWIDEPHPAMDLHPSPATAGAPGNRLRTWCGIVPVSPTGTRASFPRICSTGMTYSTGFLWSRSYKIWDPFEFNHSAKTKE